ncbi:phage minor capsid protein [Clostridium polynesiense]|uniref:phage minor capsid protein n=1 Tax=Clostridium polynesiense TaxID=1325933 RepID=UPI000B131AAA|nr:phage minor capsid protein [Clostridium polynesiense]
MAKKLSDILKNIFKNSSLDELNKSNKDKAYDIRKIFEQMELDLISSMKRAFYYHEREQRKEGFQWEQWQRAKLRGMEKYRKENREIIGSYSAPIEKAIRNELNNKYNNGQSRVENLIDRIRRFFNPEAALNLPDDISEKQATREYIAKILNRPVEPPPEENFFSVNDKKLNALQETVKNDIKNANVSVLRKMDDVYRQTIFKVEMYMSAGTKSLNQAVDMATKDFLDKGINSIIYKDGKRVNIASYAEMALRTASHRATLLGEGKKRDEWGLHLVVVSAHANTCQALCTLAR